MPQGDTNPAHSRERQLLLMNTTRRNMYRMLYRDILVIVHRFHTV